MEKTPERIRMTISVPVEVHATFQRLAKALGTSISWAMGEWLGDTLEAAELTTSMVERARAAPKQVIRELNAMALGFKDETGAALRGMRSAPVNTAVRGLLQGGGRAAEPLPAARKQASPPSSNTGGKGPDKGNTKVRR